MRKHFRFSREFFFSECARVSASARQSALFVLLAIVHLWPARITLHPTCRASQAPVRQRHVGSTQIGPPLCAATFGRASAFTELAAPSRTLSRRRRHRRRRHRHQPTSSRLRRATRFYATAASRSPPPARRASISSLRLRRFGSRERPCGRCGLPSPPRASRSGRGCGTRSARARCAAS